MQNDYAARGFDAVAVNLSEDMDNVVKVYARQNTNPYLRDDGTAWSVYAHNDAVPTNYVIDTAGVVRYWAEGYDESAIRNLVESLLPAK